MLIALAALTATGVCASQVSTTKTHRKTPVVSSHAAHPAYSYKSGRNVHQAARVSPSLTHSNSSTAHRQSADEVGRTAGLAIRNQLAQRHATRRRTGSHEFRYAVYHPAHRAHLTRTAALISAAGEGEPDASTADQQTGVSHPMEDTANGTDDAQEPQAARTTPNPQSIDDTAEDGSAAVGRMTAPMVARGNEAEAAVSDQVSTADGSDGDDRNLPPPSEAASVRTESEEASLVVPHGLMPSPLRGSLESLERQNAKLDAEGLERIEDETDLTARIADGLLVPVPASGALTVNSDLPANHRYCRPWTARFLADLARSHAAVFHKPLEVSSAVRTVEYQRRLMMTNGNAAPAEGDIVSPHLTGATVDIAKSGLSRQEMAWMRQHLLALQTAGKIDVEEEFRQACFHITVYKNYMPAPATRPKHHEAPSEADEAGATTGM